MRLTKFTDLALRVVMHLAVAEPSRVLTTRELAEFFGAPYHHVTKIVSRLQHLGLVEARRGRGGGLVLTGAGRLTTVGALVRELEGEGDVADCEGQPCPLRSACRLRGALRKAQQAFYASLDEVTVDDLTAPPTRALLTATLGMRPG